MARAPLNLGILAHVDAGKTTLTERLLYAAGVINQIGSVDDGTTQTDTLALERQRGITIKSAVVSFRVRGATVNLIDTPGHPDFIAEVERAIGVLDGAVLVISAVEGVQPQTRILMRVLQRLGIPTILFVNKIDRRGADCEGVLAAISKRLTPAIVPIGAVGEAGTRAAVSTPWNETDAAAVARLAEALSEHDPSIVDAYLSGDRRASPKRLREELARQTRSAVIHPVLFGSALTGAGIGHLMHGIAELLVPQGTPRDTGLVSGRVFKVDRGAAGDKVAYVRMFSGSLGLRERVRFGSHGAERKITGVEVFADGATERRAAVSAGQIAKLHGLTEVRVGDDVGVPWQRRSEHAFAPPSLETVVEPRDQHQRSALGDALGRLAEQDPLIAVRLDEERGEITLSLYGEVQKEVIGATLVAEFGIDVEFRDSTTICVERPIGTGAAVERLKEPPNPFVATVGLRVDPAPAGSGVEFRIAVELGSMPLAFFRAVEDTVRATLEQGLHGWSVIDCTVTMTHSGYLGKHSIGHAQFTKSISSTGEDYRKLTPLVLMAALVEAGTVVCEPIHAFRLDVPTDVVARLVPALSRLRAIALTQVTDGGSSILTGEVPAARVHDLRQRLPAWTRGEGALECAFSRYERVRGSVPARPRTGPNPLVRAEYLMQVAGYARSVATASATVKGG